MNRYAFYAASVVGAASLVVLGAGSAHSAGGQGGALVRLQTTSPGAQQVGHISVSGTGLFGKVGIGTSLPAYKLDVVGTDGNSNGGAITGTTTGPNGNGIVGVALNGSDAWGVWGNTLAGVGVAGTAYGVTGSGKGGAFQSASPSGVGVYGVNSAGGLAGKFEGQVYVNGRLGLGTATPQFSLSIQGALDWIGFGLGNVAQWQLGEDPVVSGSFNITETNVEFGRLHISPGGNVGLSNLNPMNRLSVNGSADFDGNVGIGTNSPGKKLEVVESAGGGTAVFGNATATTGATFGGRFESASTAGHGVYGVATATSGETYGVEGRSASTDGRGVFGEAYAATGQNFGVQGQSLSTSGRGVYGWAKAATGTIYGVYGQSSSAAGFGLWAQGRTGASGTKSFRIDHPQDPLNKYLLHYSAEGPEPLNVYRGTVTTDAKGAAWVQLPSYYEDINKDPSYQLTVVDDTAGPGFVQVKVAKKIKGDRFMIMTSAPNIEVCWEVKALRNDAYVQKYGAPVEVNKEGKEKGKYQHPELYGAPPEMGMNYQPPMDAKGGKPKGG